MTLTRSALVGLAIVLASHRVAAQTRSELDRADERRRCLVADSSLARETRAIRCAEWFIGRQGYTLAAPVADTSALADEGVEWEAGARAKLAGRRGSLEPRAFGICTLASGTFEVAFWAPGRRHARVVTLDPTLGSLRVQHADFRASVVTQRKLGCHPVQPQARR